MNLSTATVVSVAALHLCFFMLEALWWTSPKVVDLLGGTAQDAENTKLLALNQGFYNLGIAGLILVFHFRGNTEGVFGMLIFIVAMGVVGSISVNWRIFVVQSLPAMIAFVLLRSL